MSFRILRAYYPNFRWRRGIEKLPDEDLEFNWFVCGHRCRDEGKSKFLELAKGVVFYEEIAGVTWAIKSKKPVRLLLLEDLNSNEVRINRDGAKTPSLGLKGRFGPSEAKDLLKRAADKNYQGVAWTTSNPEETQPPGEASSFKSQECPVCREAFFIINDSVLVRMNADMCGIVDYAKRHNKRLQSMILDFPNIKEIDSRINREKDSDTSNSTDSINGTNVCTRLYKNILDSLHPST